ncbi:unnamed protein product [Rangifer tarandus platyrhynchus]|uniref:Uncharacterized protein n=2 Tax=Rangifer tarandus platyrhynchus TaxID=3082113 RepID=A0ACB0EVI4_RANTA|nr:unnamed protein product [Rangifer tarandus platyrhynchus]CAI9704159.1 unnamed protein product [Rangifer tarandus platyrhynchus]
MAEGGDGGGSEEPPPSPECRGGQSLSSPGDSSPGLSPGAEQRRREERVCPRLPAPAPRPPPRSLEPTPPSETLQPTSPQSSRALRREQKKKWGQSHAGTRDAPCPHPSRTRRTTPGAAGPGPRSGRPAVPGREARRFPPLP